MTNYLYQEIVSIRQRPGAHLGSISITVLRDYLNGFNSALNQTIGENAFETDSLFPLDFCFFHEYVARYYNWFESTAGWKDIILQENNFDEEKGLWVFYELFDNFNKLAAQHCYVAELSEQNINHHYTDKFAPKRAFPPDYKDEPVYKDPINAFIIELTGNAGYLCLIKTNQNFRLEHVIYKAHDEVKTYIGQCFGRLDWKNIDSSKIDFNTKVSYY